jgi:hypothetical protein
MKTYQVTIRTSFYKKIEIQAEDCDKVRSAAWEHIDDNDPTYPADCDVELYEIQEMGEAPKLLASEG